MKNYILFLFLSLLLISCGNPLTLMAEQNNIDGRLYNEPSYAEYTNLAIGLTTNRSSIYTADFESKYAVDGSTATAWGSKLNPGDPQWMYVDLGYKRLIHGIRVKWFEIYYAKKYQIYASNDANSWQLLVDKTDGKGGTDEFVSTAGASYRYCGIYCIQRNSIAYGVAEMEILKQKGAIKYGGLRYYAGETAPFENVTDIANCCNTMSTCYPNSKPSIVWIVNNSGLPTDYDKQALTAFQQKQVNVYLQVQPYKEDVLVLIDRVFKAYKSYNCVIGFGVDVEWFSPNGEDGINGEDYWAPVTDALAEKWENKVKSYNKNYRLFLKHFQRIWEETPEKVLLPKTYRGEIIFVNDTQGFPDLKDFKAELSQWADFFYPNAIAVQIGYPDDKPWWVKFSATDIPARVIGQAIANEVSQEISFYWVDVGGMIFDKDAKIWKQ